MKEAAASVEGVGKSGRKSKGWLTEFDKSTKLGGLAIASQRLDKFGGQMRSTGRTMTTHMTLPVLALGGAAVKAAVDYETAFAGVRKTIDASESEFEMLSTGIRGLAKEIPVSTTELAAIAEAAGQLGIENKSILGFTRTMADLGVATNMTSDVAADQMARLANITQMPQKNFDRLGATVVDLGNKLAATESEIVEMGLRIAGAGNQVGLSEHEILSLAGTLTSVGIRAEAGGTAISTTMLKMMSAVRGGGDELKSFAKVSGISSDEFKKQFEKDATGAIITFLEGIKRMNREKKDVAGALKEVGLGGIRVTDMLLRSSGAGDLMAKSLKIGANAWRDNTALTTEAERRYKTTASQLQIMKNRLSDIGITIGSELLPPFNDVVGFLSGKFMTAVEDFGKLPKGLKTATVAAVLLAAAIGPLMWLAGGVLSGFAKLGKGVLLLVKAFRFLRGLCLLTRLQLVLLKVQVIATRAAMLLWRAALVAVRVAMIAFRAVLVAARTAMLLFNLAMMANPIGLIILGIVALIAIFVLAYKKIGWFRAGVDAAFAFIKKIVVGAVNFIKRHWKTILAILTGPVGLAVLVIASNWDKIKAGATAVKDWIVDKFNAVVGFIRGLPGRIKSAASGMWDGIKTAFVSVYNWIKEKIEWIVDKVNWAKDKLDSVTPGGGGGVFGTGMGPKLDFPGLAGGGLVRRTGALLVGEEGPELLRLPGGARVDPLPSGEPPIARVPRTRTALGSDAEMPDFDFDADLNPRFHLYLDGKEIAVVVKKHADDEAARR